jgi:Tfp pilus assembly protein PilX
MRNSLTNSHGAAVFIVLIYVLIVLSIVTHTLSFLGILRPISRNEQERMRLYYIAEAGLYLTAEEMLKNPRAYIPRDYSIDGTNVSVTVESRPNNEILMVAVAHSSSWYTMRLRAVINVTTGKITNWSEMEIGG